MQISIPITWCCPTELRDLRQRASWNCSRPQRMATLSKRQPIFSSCSVWSQKPWVFLHSSEAQQMKSVMESFSLTIWSSTPAHSWNQDDTIRHAIMTPTPEQGSQWQQQHHSPPRQTVHIDHGCRLGKPNSCQQCYGQSSSKCTSSSKVRWHVTYKVYPRRLVNCSCWSRRSSALFFNRAKSVFVPYIVRAARYLRYHLYSHTTVPSIHTPHPTS